MVQMKPDIARGLGKPEAQGFARNMIGRRTTQEWLVTSEGIAIPALVHKVDADAIGRVIERITRGLYFHHMRRGMPKDAVVHVVHEFSFGDPSIRWFLEELRSPSQELFEIGNGEFTYQAFTTSDPLPAPEITAILMTFYQAISFLGLVGPAGLFPGSGSPQAE
jgi:hypothetical protein